MHEFFIIIFKILLQIPETLMWILLKLSLLLLKFHIGRKICFENIFKRKKYSLARLQGIGRFLAIKDSRYLSNIENELCLEYETIRNHEDIFWKQKSHADLLVSGDRNASYFHASFKGQYRKVVIKCAYW